MFRVSSAKILDLLEPNLVELKRGKEESVGKSGLLGSSGEFVR